MSFIVPDLEWYTGRSRELHLGHRCPFATVEVCPRYYQSLSLLGEAGSTPIEKQEDDRLLDKWKQSDLWPKTQEQETSISGPEGEARYFSNFCPEVTFDRYGYFARYLGRYADEIDQGLAHESLGKHLAPKNDWRWAWASVEPQHYGDCPLFSVLSHRHREDGHPDGGRNGNISTTHIEIGNIGQVGSIGHISGQAKVTIDQSTHYSQNDLTKVQDLITAILARQADLKPGLPSDRLAGLETTVNDIQTQLSQPTPDSSLIKSSLATLKRILEGAAGNVVASGWLKELEGLV